MSIYNLIEYSDNYSKTSEFLQRYYRDELALAANGTTTADFTADNAITDSFKITEKITGKIGNNGTQKINTMVP